MARSSICRSDQLEDGGNGFEFEVLWNDEVLPAFAVRFSHVVYAYINRCSHMELKLNFIHDDFFDLGKENLICATHGALYDPETGDCVGGPCNGVGLVPIPVTEVDGEVLLVDNTLVTLSKEEQ